jgi:iminophenyl-pyruvate dimer synthase VioB
MSIIDFPRLHFKGVARVNVPTGNRNVAGTLDIAKNTALQAGVPFDITKHPSEYHAYLRNIGKKYNAQGSADDAGPFNQAAGYNMMGNNHFSWENTHVIAVQTQAGKYQKNDALVGCKLALWGHYNDYLRTSFNRARWVDNDPTRRDSGLIYAGQITISEQDAEATAAHVLSADIHCTHGVRWLNSNYIKQPTGHFLDKEMAEARLFQFSVDKNSDDFIFNKLGINSHCLSQFKKALEDDDVLGLTVQYCVSNLSPPTSPDMPVFCDLHGCIGLWRKQDMATCPTGRVLHAINTEQYSPIVLSAHPGWLSVNMPLSIPHQKHLETLPVQNGMPPTLAKKLALGDLSVKTHTGELVAIIPQTLYQESDTGVFDVPLLLDVDQLANNSLELSCPQNVWVENDWNIQAEQHITAMESPHPTIAEISRQKIAIRSYFRGLPATINEITTHIHTPKVLHCDGLINTDQTGQASILVKSIGPGSGEINLGKRQGIIQVRVLSDDWSLLDVPDEAVDYTFLYQNVMGYYELLYPFMADKVFSMADKCKCETYARLMWQMCDPHNRDKSYYMPSTREMSTAKSHLFLKYLANVEQSAIPKTLPAIKPPFTAKGSIKDKAQLIAALKDAVDLELSIMLQYLYSAYSLPNYATGERYVKAKRWSEAQLHLVNGDKERRQNSGWRGNILEIAHEEMIHYLVINNLLMSLGEPFTPGKPVFGEEAKAKFGLDTEFSFEPFSEQVIAKFVRFEWPKFFPSIGKSIADFYSAIRCAFHELPDLYNATSERVGGEHHLFLNEIINRSHPGYQFEVYNRETALFAIDFVTEQGEGASADSPQFEVSHFNRLRAISKALLHGEEPFELAFPVLKNPVFLPRHGCSLVTNKEAQQLMKFYKGCHELMFNMMMQHFAQRPLGSMRRSRMMNAAIDLMTGILRPLSVHLMTLPSGIPGRNAGPPVPDEVTYQAPSDFSLGCQALSAQCEALATSARSIDQEYALETQIDLLDFYQNMMLELATGKLSKEG